MPAKGIQHVDLAVADVGRSLAFYSEVLEPLGFEEEYRIESPPEDHHVSDKDYYAFLAFDPDGIRVEVFRWKRANSASAR